MQRLHDFLAVQADRRPEAPAIVFRGISTTYGELERASNRLARAFQNAGCSRGDRIALLLPKSTNAIVGMFAALKADCIYIPIDTSSPVPRIGRILQQCECRCLLAERSTANLLNELVAHDSFSPSTQIGWVDDGTELDAARAEFRGGDIASLPEGSLESEVSPDEPAHILFTSGSTGMPKGVVITHANVAHFVRWATAYFCMRPEDRISGHPPLHFDLSTFDIYGTMAVGAQIHLLTPEISLLPHKLAEFIRTHELTQWFSVPWVLHQMAKFNVVRQDDFPALRRLLWCGEKLPTPALVHWMKRLPHVTFDNLYGPTEATIASSYYRVAQCPDDPTAEIPIGSPCRGELLLVLDDQLRPVKPGETGDLYIGGVGLSPGYWKNPEKSLEVFRQNPYSSNPSDRIYKTGDLARIGPDDMLYLVGRSDSQIKSRGYRIELGEIEAAVHAIDGVRDAAVVALDSHDPDQKSICCAYVPNPDGDATVLSVRSRLAETLPRYMLPQRWMVLDDLPRNNNGKTDRPLLKQWFHQQMDVDGGAFEGKSAPPNEQQEPLPVLQ